MVGPPGALRVWSQQPWPEGSRHRKQEREFFFLIIRYGSCLASLVSVVEVERVVFSKVLQAGYPLVAVVAFQDCWADIPLFS